ncbi:hypothetical protein [Dongia mobilis]|uniref:hypothetical protein n=1 Tax=Dongia sp. TaxID=1977262 RepID=UPI0026EA6521
MRRFLLALVILAIGFIWAPQVVESATSACDALEQKTIAQESGSNDLASSLVQNLSGGAVAEQAMKDRHPNLPTAVSCSLEYWKATVGVKD